jgi:SAM-dependent methyltransferase
MLEQAEPFTPPEHLVSLLRQIAASIAPDEGENWVLEYAHHHTTRLAFDLDVVMKNAMQGAKILEYGAVPLLLTAAVKALGHEVESIDIAPERFGRAIAQLNLAVQKVNIELEPVPFHDNSFDVVIFNELFEHLRINPVFTLKEVHRVLKRGGKLLLSTPNLRSLDGIKHFLIDNLSYSCSSDLYEQYRKLDTIGHMGHVREYTTREVIEFLHRIGFRVDSLLWRGAYSSRVRKAIVRIAPNLRPFFSVIATKS